LKRVDDIFGILQRSIERWICHAQVASAFKELDEMQQSIQLVLKSGRLEFNLQRNTSHSIFIH